MTALAPLVGRQDVLDDLDRVLAQARRGRGALVLVTGEPGIGKTRVAEELAAAAEGFAVQWAWCTAEQSAGSLRPWALVLRALAGAHTEVAALVSSSTHLGSLLAGTTGSTGDPELARSLLSSDLAQVLQVAARSTPLLVVLDDLHDAQPSTLRLLADLTGAVRTCPVVVLATARDGAADWQDREQLRGELLGQAHRLPLGPLHGDDIGRLLGQDGDTDVVQDLLARTGGNALLVTEMARALGTDEVPASLRAIVAARLARLDPAGRELLRAASVLGARFRLDVLADTAAVSLTDVSGLLGQAFTAALATPSGPGAARFTHELLRDAVYAELAPPDRERWHARAGEVLDGLCARGRAVEPAEVAHHLLRAGSAHTGQAAAHALTAARRAAAMSAFDDAVRWYDDALAGVDDPADRTTALLERARARRGTGDHDRSRQDVLAAAALAPTPELLAEAALALGTGAGGFEVDASDAAQLDLLERALVALPDEALALRAAVTARLSVARRLVAPAAELLAQAEEAVRLARAAADPSVLAGALAALCDAIGGPDHVAARLAHAAEIVALAGADAEVELLGRRLRLLALLEAGDRVAAEQEARAYQLRAETLRHPLFLWYVPLWQGFWALAEGRYDECRRFNGEAERIGAGSENAFLLTVTQEWCRLAQSGDAAGVKALFAAHDPSEFAQTWGVITLALSLLQCGEVDEARRRFDTVAGLVQDLPVDAEWLPTMAQVAELVAGLGGHPLAAEVYRALSPYQGLFVVEGIGAATRGPVDRFLALLAPDPATRRRHEAEAERLLRSIGATGLLQERTATGASWRLEGETWAVSWAGRQSRLRDSKGMRDLAALLAAPGREVAALDLYGVGAPLEHDTGEVLDASAREAYKRRLRELEGDELSEREQLEREALLDQLSAAYGLGGRVRRTGSSAERARSAVTARVRDALKRIAECDPELARHLRHAVRTGTFCSYAPEHPVDWDLTS